MMAKEGPGAGQHPAPSANAEFWPHPVDGNALLCEIVRESPRYVVMSTDQTHAVALWVLACHAFDGFSVFPRLFISAPEKGCGKSTLVDFVSCLVPRPLQASSITAAALFRVIERDRPTLLLDEADTYVRKSDDLRGVLNAGHRRDGAVVRCVGDNHDPRRFSAWAPVVLAAIGDLPGTNEDRSIRINLRRRRPDENIEDLRRGRERLKKLGSMAARWAADFEAVLRDSDPVMPAGIINRAADNWLPLLAVADAVGGDWPECARRAAVALARDGASDAETPGIILLADLRELFVTTGKDGLFTVEILKALCEREDRPWSEYQRGRPMTPRQLAQLLRPYRVRTNRAIRRGDLNLKGYRAEDLEDAWARYLPSNAAVTRSQT